MEIIEYQSCHKGEWDTFVRESNNGTMFHLMQFLEYHPPGRFPFQHLLFRENDEIIAVLPGGLWENGTYESPVGGSYGSFVAKDINVESALKVVDAFESYCRGKSIREVFLTPAPFIYQKIFSQNLDFVLMYRGFNYQRHYISHAIKLDRRSDLLASFQSTARRNVRKTMREPEVTVDISDDYAAFYPILAENKKKFNAKPTHSYEDLLRLKKLLPENLVLLLLKVNGRPVAGSLMFLCNPKVALCFYNMLCYEYEEYKPVYRLMYEVVKWATEKGFEWFDIGVSQDIHAENPMTPSLNLIYFKEKFNSRGLLRSTFYKKIQ
ncbi:MAG: GNAT family N-acetyltransferase [Bacteroidota bacterium]